MLQLDGYIEPESISLCPICDNPIFIYEFSSVIAAGGSKCLAHSDCASEMLADNSESEED